MSAVFDSAFLMFLTRAEGSSSIAHLLHKMGHAIPFNRGANYFKLLDDGRISYLLGAKEKMSNQHWGFDAWSASGRTAAKAPRAVKSLLPDVLASQFTDVDYEVFSDQIKTFVERGKGSFHIVQNSDIPYWYHYNQYADGDYFDIGTLQSSCMRYDETMPYLNFYTSIPNVSMVIYTTADDKLLGRALLWSFEGGTFMDRVYGSVPTQNAFLSYAKENGWYTREEQTYRNPTHWVDPSGEPVTRMVQIALLNEPDWNQFPYLDTFAYVSVTGHYLTNDPMDSQGQLLAQSTHGGVDAHKGLNRRCECGMYRSYSEVWDEGEGGMCYRCTARSARDGEATATDPAPVLTIQGSPTFSFGHIQMEDDYVNDSGDAYIIGNNPFDEDVTWELPTSRTPLIVSNDDTYSQIIRRMEDASIARRDLSDPWA